MEQNGTFQNGTKWNRLKQNRKWNRLKQNRKWNTMEQKIQEQIRTKPNIKDQNKTEKTGTRKNTMELTRTKQK